MWDHLKGGADHEQTRYAQLMQAAIAEGSAAAQI